MAGQIATKETKHGTIVVDAQDADLLKSATVGKSRLNYFRVEWFIYSEKRKRTRLKLHRVIMERMTGASIPAELFVDHIDGNPLNNCRGNLRTCNRSQNNRNSKTRSHNTTGFKGVKFNKKTGRYGARITTNGKVNYLGAYDTPEEAHAAYVVAARELHGDFANDGDGCLILGATCKS